MIRPTTYTKTPSQNSVERDVHVIDATDKILGRVASEISLLLQGKNKRNFTYNIDMGDYVVVVNVKKIRVTGKKWEDKEYGRYSGYQGGLKKENLISLFQRRPSAPLFNAVKGMLPDNKLKKGRLGRLYIFAESDYNLPKEILKIMNKDK
jgi:large subunit ribosomal protein L13